MKKFLFASLITFLVSMVVVAPVFAFSSVQFNIYDGLTLQPWGTSPGQSYRIYVSGSVSGTLLDTGTLTTPGDPVLDFTCAYDGACPPGYGTTLTAPAANETVNIYIILSGTVDNPSTIIASFQQPPLGVDLGTFSITRNTGTGPNAIELAEFSVTSKSSGNFWLPFALLVGSVALVSGAVAVIRKRKS